MFTKPLVVLMTATLDPGHYRDAVQRCDPQLRAKDYVEALKFWAELNDPRISGVVFCENSGGDPERLLGSSLAKSALRRPIEWIGFEGNARPTGMHYGYSELGILDHALLHSELLQGCDYFLKVTGRLTFPKISRLLDSLDDDVRFIADCRKSYRSEGGPSIRVRTELMLFEKQFFLDVLHQRREEMLVTCSHLEEFVATKVIKFRDSQGIALRFKTECPSVGTGAHGDVDYQSAKFFVKSKARQFMRTVAPGVWL